MRRRTLSVLHARHRDRVPSRDASGRGAMSGSRAVHGAQKKSRWSTNGHTHRHSLTRSHSQTFSITMRSVARRRGFVIRRPLIILRATFCTPAMGAAVGASLLWPLTSSQPLEIPTPMHLHENLNSEDRPPLRKEPLIFSNMCRMQRARHKVWGSASGA